MGLNYPSQYAFADCFRFVSLGFSTTRNSIANINDGWGTTGLTTPSSFVYIGSIEDGVSLYEANACGYREEANQVILTRSWRIPKGTDHFEQNYTFNEFMVTPGRPFVFNPKNPDNKACSSNQLTAWEDNNDGTYYDGSEVGKDGSYVADAYTPSICSADKAFARIVKAINVFKDDYLVVTYDLGLTFPTGLQNFTISAGGTSPVNWNGTITGKAGLIHHGIKLINDGNTQIYRYQYNQAGVGISPEYGESFTSSWGCPMEPSFVGTLDGSRLAAYLSTDNIQFCINNLNGGNILAGQTPSSFPVMTWHPKPTFDTSSEDVLDLYINPRKDGSRAYYPNNSNYITDPNDGNTGPIVAPIDVDFTLQSVPVHTPLYNFVNKNDRVRYSSYSFEFWDTTAGTFLKKPIRALVLGYQDYTDSPIYPFFDSVFMGRNGKYVPIKNTALDHSYSLPTDDNPPTGYFYLEDGGQLAISYLMSWSSPCDAVNVDGC
jgi:hypothetical protein